MSATSGRLPRVLPATLAIAGLTLIAAAALLWGTGGFRELPTSFARGPLPVSAGMFAAVCYVGAGWLLTSRIPRNPIGWLLLAMGLVFAVMTPTALLVDAAHRAFRPAPPTTIAAAWLLSTFSGPFLVGASITTGLLFPDGRLAGPRWRWPLALAIVGAVLLAFATAVRPAGLIWYPTLPNPFAAPSAFRPFVTGAMSAATILLVAGAAAMVWSLIGRYRRGDATVRAQLRWILYAGAAQASITVPFMVIRYIAPVGEALGELMVAVADATLALLPIAAAVAITRYRLFGIDFIISRTLVYVPMMGILGGMYTATIAIFQRIFVAVTGETSDAPLVLTIFLVAAAFTPVRKGLEGVVDRWIRGPTGASRPRAGIVGEEEMTPRVAEVAARVIALQGLEARVAAGAQLRRSAGPPRQLAIDAEARVVCPGGGAPHFVACLDCRYFGALVTDPPTVLCTRPAAGATSSPGR